ncbi:mannose-1-phosphate guanylyltransferase/mannose-6-phosphate isomerase [Pseudoalteromonas sp. XMcav1-K]|uniref:mannose-1-phosphate guanylyltransferase/mannose-6-phosphate isomerase n=1 Tax=Pseudoalteromonas sp. XMcav1-K TaxID=3374372 RepID=UPI003757B4B5
MLLPVILAGGSGSRLWPISRQNFPKQFHKLTEELTMFQQTLRRLEGLKHQPSLIICNEEHRFIAAEQIRQLGINHNGIFLEPVGRNTAPAIAIAALKAIENNQDPVLLVLAADHVINDVAAFQQSVNLAAELASNDKLVTFGIVGDQPHTGYGYINRGEQLSNHTAYKINKFVEKPDLATAQEYIASEQYYWNSGMFMFKASRYLTELKSHRPDIYQACAHAMQNQNNDLDFIRVDKAAFESCPDESIDYAVMEKTQDAAVVPLNAGWNDVGGFSALWEELEKDHNGNACNGDIKTVETENSLIFSDSKLVTTIGVRDLVVVNTKDAVLVAHKDKSQKVKDIVNQLAAEQRSETNVHREVYRPWGKYDAIDAGERFQVKRITVKPGAKLSVQMHHHRAEHWIIVSGKAKVQIGDNTQLVTENESVYIPIATVHALENPGKVNLELIEVQSGSYLGEDDIIRFEDRYGRVEGK